MSRTATIDETTVWKGPFLEIDKYGEPTGHRYVTCRACGVQVLVDDREHATHREGCVHA